MKKVRTQTQKSYILHEPSPQVGPVFLSSPHSGRDYAADFLESCLPSARQIRSSEDAFVDSLIIDAPKMGAGLLLARAPRAFLDLNRGADELDHALIADVARATHNPRINSGLGVIPRVVAGGRAIYSGKISLHDAQTRITTWWQPWHQTLAQQLQAIRHTFGQAILLDCHSMPHEALDGLKRRGAPLPQIVLGDRFGASACPEITAQIETAFQREGFITARNAPFAGAFITQHYGRPTNGQHAIQIEIDRSLYMHEADLCLRDDFEDFRARINRVLARVISHHSQIKQEKSPPLAAE